MAVKELLKEKAAASSFLWFLVHVNWHFIFNIRFILGFNFLPFRTLFFVHGLAARSFFWNDNRSFVRVLLVKNEFRYWWQWISLCDLYYVEIVVRAFD